MGSNGKLYYRYITAANPGVASWITRGNPPGKSVRGVSISPDGEFVSTYDNYICEYSTSTWLCYGKPPGSLSKPSTAISKAYRINSCSKLPGSARYIFMNSWDPVHKTRGRIYSLKIGYKPNWTYHGTVGPSYYYIGSPEMFVSWNCPKVFATRSDGTVYERYLQ